MTALSRLEPDWWLELDRNYVERLTQRRQLYHDYEANIMQCLPGSELACKEPMEMCIQFLCARYPQYFSVDVASGVFRNKILNQVTDLKTTARLAFLLDNVPEDFAIMMRDPETGYYYF
jgi:Protein of unknown function (DUF3445)